MMAGAPARMGFLWSLALPLFFCCWVAGALGSTAGPSTSRPGPLVTMNHTEVPAVTPALRTSSEGVFQTTDLAETSGPSHVPLETQILSTQTSERTLIPGSTISEAETGETKAIFLATETRALTKITPSKFMVVITTPVETSATSDNPTGRTGMTAVQTVIGSDLLRAAVDTLCSDDSSEEAKRITPDVLTLARAPAEAEALALKDSAFSAGSVPATTTSQALVPDTTAPAKALVASANTDIEVTSGSDIEIETTATIPGTSDVDHSPTGGKALSTPEMSALPNSTEAKSHLTEPTTSAETLSTAGATESATPDTTVETPFTANSTTEGATTAAKATSPSGTLATFSMNPWEEISVLSADTTSHTEVSGTLTMSTEAGSTVGKVTSPATVYSLSEAATIKSSTRSETSTTDSTTNGPIPISCLSEVATVKTSTPSETSTTDSTTNGPVPISSLSEVATVKSSTPSETSTTDSTTNGPIPISNLSEVATIMSSTPSETSTTDSTTNVPIPISRSPLSSVHLTTAYSSQETNITLAKTTASAKTLKTASTARGKPPTAMPPTAQTRWTTEVTAGGDGGFLLLRLSVASPEDLTDPRVAERLMQQLRRALQAHTPPSQVSLLRVRRG
ncbi:mucin-20 [Diceros bicornis minor]|uniref:mucin-20 n=1 Tax=Diceros bicornis minor TaxID=77932 RepID=UPI0026EAD459|nr:mucin-20 [Diceros bicornis minor]